MSRPPEMKVFYEGWATQHRRMLDSIRPLTPDQMQLRAAPREWAIWQLASNMARGRLYWLCAMLGEDDRGTLRMFAGGGWEDAPAIPARRTRFLMRSRRRGAWRKHVSTAGASMTCAPK